MIEKLLQQGVFVVHALKGYEYHEKRLIDLFDKHGISHEFITDGDPIHFTDEILEKYFVPDIKSILSAGVLSCTLNHIYCLEKIVERNLDYALIFENDPFFLGNFVEQLSKMANEIENLSHGFMISLENSTLRLPSYWDIEKNKHLYQASTCRMSGSYLIDRTGAVAILQELKYNKCPTVIDGWHDLLIRQNIIKMFWAHPPLVEEGSHNGHLNATISTKPRSLFRRITWSAQKLYKLYIRRLFPNKYLIKPNTEIVCTYQQPNLLLRPSEATPM
jgi:glycosyl transferase, family 25